MAQFQDGQQVSVENPALVLDTNLAVSLSQLSYLIQALSQALLAPEYADIGVHGSPHLRPQLRGHLVACRPGQQVSEPLLIGPLGMLGDRQVVRLFGLGSGGSPGPLSQ